MAREAGPASGRLRITCKGCGQSVGYRAAESGEVPGLGSVVENTAPAPAQPSAPQARSAGQSDARETRMLVPPPTPGGLGNGAPPPSAAASPPSSVAAPPSPAAGPTPKLRRPAPEPARIPPRPSGASLPPDLPPPAAHEDPGSPWIPRALIGGVITVGLAMIAAGVIRSSNDTNSQTPSASVPARTQATQNTASQPAATTTTTPTEPSRPASVPIETRSFGSFVLAVPKRWNREPDSEAIRLRSPGGNAEIRVFFAPGNFPLSAVETSAQGLLRRDHPGAQISSARKIKFEKRDAVRIREQDAGGGEDAVAFSTGSFGYVILTRLDKGVSQADAEQAAGILASFSAK